MDEKALVQDETQIFIFGFNARELFEEFEGMVHYYLNETIKVIKESFDEVDPYANNISIDVIEDFYKQDCKPRLKEFKKAVKEIFHVPDNVELPLPEMVKEHVTEEDVDKEEHELEQLEEQLKQARVYQAALEHKKQLVTEYVEPMLKVIDACLKAREDIKNKGVIYNYFKVINKVTKGLRQNDTIEKDYIGCAEKIDFYKDFINK